MFCLLSNPKTTTIHNVLTRAGTHVTLAKSSLDSKDASEPLIVNMARGMSFVVDVQIDQIQNQHFDAVVIPGGVKGAENLRDDPLVIEKIRHQLDRDMLTGAICATPAIILAGHGLLDDRCATCYPGFEASIPNPSDDSVVVDGKLVTSKGPGTAIAFALTLVEFLLGCEVRQKVADQILYPGSL